MAAEDFTPPEEFTKKDAQYFEDKMMAALPADIDRMPGGFPYDFTMPTALIAEELVQEDLMTIVQIIFPEYSYGTWLDLLAKQAGLSRRSAGKATGSLEIRGRAGTVIPQGSQFCTLAVDDAHPSVVFETDEAAMIPEGGTVTVPITCTEAGTEGNVSADTIITTFKYVSGITNVGNREATSGGVGIESDDELRERIALANAARGLSFVGNDSDFIRWAKEVDGVGKVVVVSCSDGPGTVTLYLTDRNGAPASKAICDAAYEHIVSPSDRSMRLLVTGCCKLTILPAEMLGISYVCTGLKYDTSLTSIEEIAAAFKALMEPEYEEAKETGIIYYNQMRGHITEITGVIDFDTFLMNGSEENIPVGAKYYPETDACDFS